ncbi:MAG: hypothetical protein JWO02_3600, partial [Solirubrobacterales bacterium]|nr:hypothetical protein [Solirubrobacterales bacterium]
MATTVDPRLAPAPDALPEAPSTAWGSNGFLNEMGQLVAFS